MGIEFIKPAWRSHIKIKCFLDSLRFKVTNLTSIQILYLYMLYWSISLYIYLLYLPITSSNIRLIGIILKKSSLDLFKAVVSQSLYKMKARVDVKSNNYELLKINIPFNLVCKFYPDMQKHVDFHHSFTVVYIGKYDTLYVQQSFYELAWNIVSINQVTVDSCIHKTFHN